MSVDVLIKPGQAARLQVASLPLYHALDDFGFPFCMGPFFPLLYPVDLETLLDKQSVAPEFRCRRFGCVSSWG